MIKIAITGNIASGKSEVENILKTMGYTVFDADKIAHEKLNLLANELINLFGNEILENNKISRQCLGNIVFNDTKKLQQLNNLIHPEIIKEINKKFTQHQQEKYIFISVPLLFETNMNTMFDKILFVYCNDELRLKRLMERNNLTEQDALKRMNAQQSQEVKIKKSDYIIKNESSINNLKSQIQNLF